LPGASRRYRCNDRRPDQHPFCPRPTSCRRALARIALRTPLTSPVLDAATGARVPQGGDPAAHRLVQVPRRHNKLCSINEDKRGGVMAISSGNQGVAAAALLNCQAHRDAVGAPREARRGPRRRNRALTATAGIGPRSRAPSRRRGAISGATV
jgi:hypothetical protein